MSSSPPFVILRKPCAEAVAWAVDNLEKTGFRAVRTFDLQDARLAHLDCPCPHHGTSECNCQMVVLLVYLENYPPASMVIHGSDATSFIYLINMPQQPVGRQLETSIRLAFGQ